MKLELQVCSLELAKQLKELGVKQDALYGWVRPTPNTEWRIVPTGLYFNEHGRVREGWVGREVYDAFTVAELGEMLPWKGEHLHCNDSNKDEYGRWGVWLYHCNPRHTHREHASTEADARAKMLIYLLEHKLVTFPDGTDYGKPCEECGGREHNHRSGCAAVE